MRQGLSSLLAGYVVAALLGLALEPTAAMATRGSSGAPRPSAQTKRGSPSHPTTLSRIRNTGVVPVAPGAGYYSPGGSASVRALQRLLARAGDIPGPTDGRYGPLTEQAVRRFQAAHALHVDGIAGPHTLAALRRPTGILYPGAGRSGARGSGSVRVLQRRLAHAGYSPGPVDGRYGPHTEHAVLRFQAVHGLRVDGIAGPQTLGALTTRANPRRRGSGPHPAKKPHATTKPQRATKPNPAQHRARTKAPTSVRHANPSTSSPWVGWLVLIGVLGMGLWLRATRESRRRRHALQGTLSGATGVQPQAERTGDAEAAFNLGVLLERQRDRDGALAAYERADQLGNAAAACKVGVLLEERGELPAAEAAYRRAHDRGDANGAFNLGVLLEQRGDTDGATSSYRRADKLGHAAAAGKLGVLLETDEPSRWAPRVSDVARVRPRAGRRRRSAHRNGGDHDGR
jgi:peptidoglycan hydrolase-like protein with peptidoglycan-binding domain